VHDLKHTFGRRLGATGVSFEDRQDLLGHRSFRITTHYSSVELSRLSKRLNAWLSEMERPELVVLRGKLGTEPRKSSAKGGTSHGRSDLNL
jgi:integrase